MPKSKGNIFLPIVSAVAIIAIIAAGFLFWQNQQQQNFQTKITKVDREQINVKISTTPTTIPSETNKNEWKSYSLTNAFEFEYPSEAKINEAQDIVSLSIWGPTQRPNTELYDGLALNFQMQKLSNKTLDDYVKEEFVKAENEGVEVLSPLSKISIAGINGYSYKVRGLGEHQYIYLPSPLKPGNFIFIGNSTHDPTNRGFENQVNQILSTFKFSN